MSRLQARDDDEHGKRPIADDADARPNNSSQEVAVMLVIGRRSGLLRELAQWLVIGAIVGVVLNSRDIERYLRMRAM